jgi:hypothetical protein
VLWREELRVRWLPGGLDGVLERTARYMFGRAMNHLLRSP